MRVHRIFREGVKNFLRNLSGGGLPYPQTQNPLRIGPKISSLNMIRRSRFFTNISHIFQNGTENPVVLRPADLGWLFCFRDIAISIFCDGQSNSIRSWGFYKLVGCTNDRDSNPFFWRASLYDAVYCVMGMQHVNSHLADCSGTPVNAFCIFNSYR